MGHAGSPHHSRSELLCLFSRALRLSQEASGHSKLYPATATHLSLIPPQPTGGHKQRWTILRKANWGRPGKSSLIDYIPSSTAAWYHAMHPREASSLTEKQIGPIGQQLPGFRAPRFPGPPCHPLPAPLEVPSFRHQPAASQREETWAQPTAWATPSRCIFHSLD